LGEFIAHVLSELAKQLILLASRALCRVRALDGLMS